MSDSEEGDDEAEEMCDIEANGDKDVSLLLGQQLSLTPLPMNFANGNNNTNTSIQEDYNHYIQN